MKVGKVIKIKVAEVNRLLFLIVILWLPVLLLSCSDEKDEQRIDEEQKEGIRVDFGNEGHNPFQDSGHKTGINRSSHDTVNKD